MSAITAGPVAPLTPADLPAVLALNAAHAAQTSPLDEAALRRLVASSVLAVGIGAGAGLGAVLIALDEGADYASPNFRWFRARYPRFLYVDRVVVDPARRGRGLARALYAALFRHARATGHARVVCEVNREPPNPASDALHAALGFAAVGTAALPGGKVVRYLAREDVAHEAPAVHVLPA